MTTALLHFKCGHDRTPENIVPHPRTPKREAYEACRTCRNIRQAKYRERASIGPLRQPKRVPRVVRWIAAPNIPAIIAECRPKYEAAIAPKPVGRPRRIA